MQRSHPLPFVIRAGGALLAGLLSAGVFAAELGDVSVRSHIGQQLSADIELVMLTAEDAAGVQVRLAAPNVYQGANVRMHPALSSLRMSVVKRDNRQFLHLTTFQPIEAELLHLFLELGTGSRASVRSATIWLTPEPAPAPRPAAVRPPAPEPASAVADMMADDAALAAQAAQAANSREVALRAARMRAAAQNAALAREAGAVKPRAAAAPGQAAAGPAADGAADSAANGAAIGVANSAVRAAASQPVKPGPAAVPIKLTPEARVAKGKQGGVPAACKAGQTAAEAEQCLALDQTNTELKTKLVDLEGKVKQLQAALAQPAAPAAAAPAALTPAAAAAKKRKEAGGVNTTTMVLGAVLLLALVAGGLAYIIRKKKITFSTAPLKVWQGWRKGKKPAEAPPAEPILNNE